MFLDDTARRRTAPDVPGWGGSDRTAIVGNRDHLRNFLAGVAKGFMNGPLVACCGHGAHPEHAAEFNRVVADFVRSA